MNFLKNPRYTITFYCFINLKLKRILTANHKCGVTYFNHLFSYKYNGVAQYIDWKNIYQMGDWHLAIERDDVQNFTRQYDEKEFRKILITRNPYDRALSFFTNTFWDTPNKKDKTHYVSIWETMAEERIKEMVELRDRDEFKKTFEIFLDIQWNNPTEGTKKISRGNNEQGNEHLYPQNLAYKGLLSDVEFIDINDIPPSGKKAKYILNFLEHSDFDRHIINQSSLSRRKLDESFFDDLDLKAFNEFYRDDFELGYKICIGALSN